MLALPGIILIAFAIAVFLHSVAPNYPMEWRSILSSTAVLSVLVAMIVIGVSLLHWPVVCPQQP